jgi:hypothetical protein
LISFFYQGLVFLFPENDANRRVFFLGFHKAVVVVYVHLHLAQVLVAYFTYLQIQERKAAKKAVVEHQVNPEMLVLKTKPHLPAYEAEALSQLE